MSAQGIVRGDYQLAVAAAAPQADALNALAAIVRQAADALAPVYDWFVFSYHKTNRDLALQDANALDNSIAQYPELAGELKAASAAIRAVAGSVDQIGNATERDQYETRRAELYELAQFTRGEAATGKPGQILPEDAAAQKQIEDERAAANKREEARAKADLCNPLRFFTGESTLGDYWTNCVPTWLKVVVIGGPILGGAVAAAYVVRAFK